MATVPTKKNLSEPFHRLLRILLLISQICCAAPILERRGNASLRRRLHRLWCLTVLIHLYVVNFVQARTWLSGHLNVTTVERGLYLGEILTNLLVVAFSMSSCHYYAEQYSSLPCKLLQIYGNLQRCHQMQRRYKHTLYLALHRELLCVVCLSGAFLAACFVVDLVHFNFDLLQSCRSSSAYNVPNVLISLNLGQYWLALRFICHLYRRLNDVMQQLLNSWQAKMPKRSANTPTHPKLGSFGVERAWSAGWYPTYDLDWYKREFSHCAHASHPASQELSEQHEQLSDLRALYADLDHLLAKLGHDFELILLLNFLASFLSLSVHNFAVYKLFDRPNLKELVLFFYELLWVVLHVGRYLFVLLPNNAIIREKCRTCFILNELATPSTEMEHEINRFLLQLMVRKPESACGIFSLDLLFLGGILSALATYVIFLIQIDLGNESLTGTKQNRSTLNTP